MSVFPSQLVSAIASIEAAVAADELQVETISNSAQAVDLLAAAERLRRLAAVISVDAVGAVQSSGAYLDHGHVSAQVMARHVGSAASSTTARLDKVRRMNGRCEQIAAAWRAGSLSVDQAAVLARAFANPRVREPFVQAQDWFLAKAARLSFPKFERAVARWVQLADVDGAAPRAERAHENRDVTLVQDHFSQQWNLRGTFGSLQGAKLQRILQAYIKAEFLADWEAAEAEHGAGVHHELLARTCAQRRADAFEQIFADGLNNKARSAPIDTVHNIVWSAESLEELIHRFAGGQATPLAADTHRCHNLDGTALNNTTAFADFLGASFRRVVANAAGVVIDMGVKQRFFTGLARLGVMINNTDCYWPGCNIPNHSCQIDHYRSAARGGLTNQSNGGPACQHHNRLKERGYTAIREPDGSISITTPKGDKLQTT